MTPAELKYELRKRAGVRGKSKRNMIPVRVVVPLSGNVVPPTLRPVNRRTHKREVVVSDTWLRLKAPKLWAAFVAGRILDLPDRLVMTSLKEEQ